MINSRLILRVYGWAIGIKRKRRDVSLDNIYFVSLEEGIGATHCFLVSIEKTECCIVLNFLLIVYDVFTASLYNSVFVDTTISCY